MKRVIVIVVCLLIVAVFFIFGRVSAEKNTIDAQEPVKVSESTEVAEVAESPESIDSTESADATIPYSDPYNSPDTGADPAEVDEDAE